MEIVACCAQAEAQRGANVVTRFILAGAERDSHSEKEAAEFGDILFTDDRLSGYRSIVHKTYFVLEYVVSLHNKLSTCTVLYVDV